MKLAKFVTATILFSLPIIALSDISERAIHDEIVDLNNAAYLSGNTNGILNKYDPVSVSCWGGKARDYFDSRLIHTPISKNSNFELKSITAESLKKTEMNGMFTFSSKPTHKLSIGNSVSYESRCEILPYSRSSSSSYFLSIGEEGYKMVAPCPTNKFTNVISTKKNMRILSKSRVDSIYSSLSETDRSTYVEQILNTGSRMKVLNNIKKMYSASLKESILVLDRICEK